DDIKFARFNSEQIKFFQEMVVLLQQERLSLDPGRTEKHLYDLQFVSLQSMERVYQWLVDSTYAILEAERQERIHGEPYNPQLHLENMDEVDVTVKLDNCLF